VLLVVAVAAIVAPMLLSGWLFTFQPVLISVGSARRAAIAHPLLARLVELGKAVFKTLVIGGSGGRRTHRAE
jgi:hypothetical protein